MTSEQQELLAKARESLSVAKLLYEHRRFDHAVSTAYYVMFYAAKVLLLGEGLELSKHSAVISAFGQHFAKTGRLPTHLHRYLNDGIEARHLADYTTRPVSEEDAREQIRRGEEFLSVVERLLGEGQP